MPQGGMAGAHLALAPAELQGFSLDTLQCKKRRMEGQWRAPESQLLPAGEPDLQEWLLACVQRSYI